MKLLLFALLFGAIVAGLANESEEEFYRNSEHPGKCVYNDLILSPGETGQPKGKCERFTCEKDLKANIERCDYRFIILEPPCWWGDVENPDPPFPDCCMRKVICPEKIPEPTPPSSYHGGKSHEG